MVMSSNSQFSPELHDLIIDELSDETDSTRTALRVCLFVSKSFRKRARRHLFSEVRIEDAGKEHGSEDLGERWTQEEMDNRLKLLIELMRPPVPATIGSDQALDYAYSQGILPYIRQVHFGFCDNGLYVINEQSAPIYPDSASYVIDILGMLGGQTSRALQSIEINGSGKSAFGAWNELIPHVRSLLLHLCCAVSSEITLTHMVEVPNSILRGTRVKHITFEKVSLFENSPDFNFEVFPEYDKDSMALLPLPNLQFAQTGDLFDEFCGQIYPMDKIHPHLHMKAFQFLLFEVEAVANAFVRVSKEYPNLEVLDIEVILDEEHGEVNQFDIQKLVFLKELTIAVDFLPIPEAVPYMTSILRFCSHPTLSTIHLSPTRVTVDVAADGSFDVERLNVFSDLDRFISDSSNFPSLKSVILHLRLRVNFPAGSELGPRDSEDEAKLRSLFQNAFPCLDLVKTRVQLMVKFEDV